MYGGWFIIQNFSPWQFWGLGAMVLGFLVLIKQLLIMLSYFFQVTDQLDLLHESRTLRFSHGRARLARLDDAFIQALARTKRGLFIGSLDGVPLFYDPFADGNGHVLAYAPSRTGKTISLIIPALLHWLGGSVIVIDVKAELSAVTAAWRRAMGQRVIILNPFGALGIKGLRFNPLRILVDDILKNGGKRLSRLARSIALQIVPEQSQEIGNGKFFRDGARRLITTGILYLAAFKPGECNLPRLRSLIWTTSEEKRRIAEELQSVDWFHGILRDYGNELAEMLEPQYVRTYGPSRDYAMEALNIYEAGSELGEASMESDFSLHDILDGKTTLYLVLPESELETHGSWLGLIITLIFEEIAMMHKPQRILMLLEEMGNIGRLPITKALSLLPGKGLRCVMVFQSRQQPIDIYNPRIAKIIEEQSSCLMAWEIRDEPDRRAWSARIGTTTKKSRSLSRDPHDQAAPWRLSVGERAAPVLSADEIERLPASRKLVAIRGKFVILAAKDPYFRYAVWRNAASPNPCVLRTQDDAGETP